MDCTGSANFHCQERNDKRFAICAFAHLARKGQALYGKFCGTDGRGICAESFAEYHLWLGEFVIVRDFLEYLDSQRLILSQPDLAEPDIRRRLAMTVDLIERVEAHLGEKAMIIQ